MTTKKQTHKHKWSRAYKGIFKKPVRVCENGECGAIRHDSGKITYVRVRVGAQEENTQ